MRRVGLAAFAIGAIAVSGARLAAEDLQPGLKAGDSPASFNIKEVVGPNEDLKGKSHCYT